MAEDEKKEHEHHEHDEKEHTSEHQEHHEKKEEHDEKEHAHEQHEKKEDKHQNHEQKSEKQAPPSGEKKDLRDSRISILVFMLAGAAVALLSSLLKSGGISSWITGAIGIALLAALVYGMTKLFKRKLKFFYASLFIYLLIWLVTWIFLYNV